MYHLDWVAKARTQQNPSLRLPARLDVSPTVWKLGFTSLFTDVSSEMISSILPLYFMFYLRFSPLQFGILDGLYQGAALAIFSLAAGICADRWRRQKEIALGGYALSSVSKLGLLLGASWTPVAGSLLLDRIGKGVRTAPRDAMISLNSHPSSLATSFAVHRGLDTVGAVVGPLLAFLLLRMVPGNFSLVLLTSFCVSLVGVGLIGLLVPKPDKVSHQAANRLTLQPIIQLQNGRSFRVLLIAGSLLALMTASDAFIYLLLQKNTGSQASIFPLFAFITACVYLLLSVPAGKLADRYGRKKVFLGGYAFLLLLYALLLAPEWGKELQFLTLGFLGIYYAATDGVLAAMASSVLPADLRTSGLAALNTATNLFRVLSSILFGWLWASSAAKYSVWIFLIGLLGTMFVSSVLLQQQENE